jgi:protein TonB
VLALVATLLMMIYLFPHGGHSVPVEAGYFPPDIHLKRLPVSIPKEPIRTVQKKTATVENTTPKISPDNQVDKNIHTMEEMDKDVKIGLADTKGDPSFDPGPPGEIMAESGESKAVRPAREEKPSVLYRAERMPAFPGGERALRRFLQRNLRAPVDALEPGSRITVRARFIVDASGKVTGIEILGTGGRIFDEEVMRVLEKMPDWSPGMQAGKPVAVYFTLPVIFAAGSE